VVRKKPAVDRLAEARAALGDTSRQIGELTNRRNAALLGDDDATAIKLDSELETLRRTERAHVDKVALLETEAENAEKERRAQERLGLIERTEKMLAERDAAGLKLQNTLIEADRQFRELIKLSEAASTQWNWPPSDLIPMLMSGALIAKAVSHEIYKRGARPPLFGDPTERIEAAFPGGTCSDHRLRGVVDQIPSLVDVLRDGSALASRIMRGGAPASAPLPSVPDTSPSPPSGVAPATPAASGNGAPPSGNGGAPDQAALVTLLKQQQILSEDFSEEGERKYAEVVRQIAALS
jgi:hypothetical protein